jgi:hypothetical protein
MDYSVNTTFEVERGISEGQIDAFLRMFAEDVEVEVEFGAGRLGCSACARRGRSWRNAGGGPRTLDEIQSDT